MKKKLLLLIPVVFFLVLIGLIVYWHPPVRDYSVRFDAVKMNRDGKQLETVPVELEAKWIYPWFEDARLQITSAEIGGFYTGLETPKYTGDRFPGRVPEQWLNEPFLRAEVEISLSAVNQYEFCDVLFSPDHQRWVIARPTRNTYYIGSVNKSDTPEDLYEYFKPFLTRN